MVGLVIDAGMMLALHRQAQNAADAAARAAAQERVAGGSDAEALAVAQTYVQSYNELAGAAVALNSPPLSGSYAGNASYIEVVVTVPSDAWFIPVVGGSRHPTVVARAVAGPNTLAATEALCVLDPAAVPGVTVERTTLRVNGRAWVNSPGAGYDEGGGWVDLGSPSYAVQRLNGGSFQGDALRTVGGVDSASGYMNADGVPCLKARQLLRSDPLLHLPTPTTATGVSQTYPGANGQVFASPQQVSVALSAGQTVTFSPGIYGSIEVTGSGNVTFQPGIYVLAGGNASGRALNLTITGTVTGNGVMFYNTGSNYNPLTGDPDQNDGNVLGTDPAATFGDVTVNASQIKLTPLPNTSPPFAGFVLYQRRWNAKPITIYHNSSSDSLVGTIYARWSKLTFREPGTFTVQVVVGSFVASSSTSGAYITINPSPALGKAKLVYLVE
jgi:Flp pilus assembly protein TadG